MNMIDTHSHLFTDEFSEDLPQVIERAKETGVSFVYMPNIDLDSIEPMLEVASRYKNYCFPMMGLHPTSVDSEYQEVLRQMKVMLKNNPIYVGIGEVGLDFYWDTTWRKEQEAALDVQIQWALEYELPLVIHCREAFDSLYDLMLPYKSESKLRGVFHSFTGDETQAERMLEFPGFYLGINGVVTFKKSSLPDVLPLIPLDRLVLETDSPYLAPVPYRGKRNESAYVKLVLERVAAILSLPVSSVAETTTKNAQLLFQAGEMQLRDFKVY